jgi:hypothetical protein
LPNITAALAAPGQKSHTPLWAHFANLSFFAALCQASTQKIYRFLLSGQYTHKQSITEINNRPIQILLEVFVKTSQEPRFATFYKDLPVKQSTK